jgi:CheY-like chemotaxis protein
LQSTIAPGYRAHPGASGTHAARGDPGHTFMSRALKPVLLVDDNPMDVELTVRALRLGKMNNPIEVARDGEEALAWIPRWEAGEARPALILLDINMPKLNGLEVLRKLKAHPELRMIPVVMLTSSSNNRDLRAAYADGANSYLVKPVDFEQFILVAAQIKQYWGDLNQLPE